MVFRLFLKKPSINWMGVGNFERPFAKVHRNRNEGSDIVLLQLCTECCESFPELPVILTRAPPEGVDAIEDLSAGIAESASGSDFGQIVVVRRSGGCEGIVVSKCELVYGVANFSRKPFEL